MFITRLPIRRHFVSTAKSSLAAEHEAITVFGRSYEKDSMTNLTPGIMERLYQQKPLNNPGHPLTQLWQRIARHMASMHNISQATFPSLNCPIVSVQENFDDLCFPGSHLGRSPSDSYYINRRQMLRTHMTVHEREAMIRGWKRFLLVGDVWRRDEIDRTHYPVFHQVEGVALYNLSMDMNNLQKHLRSENVLSLSPQIEQALISQDLQGGHDPLFSRMLVADMIHILEQLIRSLLPNSVFRWTASYFPFTQPSFELEIQNGKDWLEVLGCGLLQDSVIPIQTKGQSQGWAFGLGLERLAMLLHDIPDIRLFWNQDPRFLSQFSSSLTEWPQIFKPYSRHPPICRDVSFYIKRDWAPADLNDLARNTAGDLIESLQEIDRFQKDGRTSLTYRLTYRAADRTLTDEQVNVLQEKLRQDLVSSLNVTLR